jgi:hypothetical protein
LLKTGFKVEHNPVQTVRNYNYIHITSTLLLTATASVFPFLAKGFPTARVAMVGAVKAEALANMQARDTTAKDFMMNSVV